LAAVGLATETENQEFRILPAPAKVEIDGKISDWDLTGGIFACGELEHLRDQYAVWFHAMYDEQNIYLLARWNDPTPLNNPEKLGGHGFNGDCLQVRFILHPETPQRAITWWTLWRDAEGRSVMDRAWPGPSNGITDNPMPNLADAGEHGVRQAFHVRDDGRGYDQEIAIPWELLSPDGQPLKAGDRLRMTIEPNFTAGSFGRITIKDIFDARVAAPDRVFTFRAYTHWGWAELEKQGNVEPQPVRTADGRTFSVSMKDGVPVVDWTGLIRKFEWEGFKAIEFEMPFDGYVSINILDKEGRVARHLLNWDNRKAGRHMAMWDGLDDPVYRTPGKPVPAGEYRWEGIAHPGAKLTFRGYASYGGRVPWESGPKDFWLGDHGVPSDVVADGTRVYLACNGAEGGRHLIATDTDGRLIWGLQNTTGAADPEHIAIADGFVYVLHPKVGWMGGGGRITRVDAEKGCYAPWPGGSSHVLEIGGIWREGEEPVDHADSIAAWKDRLYLSISSASFFNEDVADWKALIQKLRNTNDAVAVRIMGRVDERACRRLDEFLAGKVDQERAFATWTGGPRFDRGVMEGLNALLQSVDLVAGAAKMSPARRARENRRFLCEHLAPALKPQPQDMIVEVDIQTRRVSGKWGVPFVGDIFAADPGIVYAVCDNSEIAVLNPSTGALTRFAGGLRNASAVSVDSTGNVIVSVGEPDMQVLVFDSSGKLRRKIGRRGGRPRIGPWREDGMLDPAGIAADSSGRLWVMEHYAHPKRVSVWDMKSGAFVRDFFGATHYGASGGAILPSDPNVMVGEGCEWRIDPATGRGRCLGAFTDHFHSYATFRRGRNGRMYLVAGDLRYGTGAVEFWERRGDAGYVLLAEIRNDVSPVDDRNPGSTEIWSDLNGDGRKQTGEIQTRPGALYFSGANSWSLNLGPDMSLYGYDRSDRKLKVLRLDGFARSGAPLYRLDMLGVLPDEMAAGYVLNESCAVPSADGSRLLVNLAVKDHPANNVWHCFDLATGRLMWTYPNPYFQVHGSHHAPAPEPGLFRGAFGPVGAVSMKGAGDVWVINGNLGEWYALTSDGYFLSRLFNGNLFEWKWPPEAKPGVDMTDLPPGCGGEDFGGSVTQGDDGNIYIQAGKLALWNLLLTGLDRTVRISGGTLSLSEEETKKAFALREKALQAAAGRKVLTVKRKKIEFTGNFGRDFAGLDIVEYRKSEDARIKTALAYDEQYLYAAWEVRDSTPWINGAQDMAHMYASGDTVDIQLGADASADPKRSQPVKGDIRISVGNFQGQPKVVLYRFVSDEKKPRQFTSGVVKGYTVDYVDEIRDAVVKTSAAKESYVVELALPLAAIGVSPAKGLLLRGDVGATHGESSGTRTKLRTHWANQQTGLVDDIVFELQINPANWGEFVFE